MSRKQQKRIRSKDPSLMEWMSMPTQEVLNKFANLPCASKVGQALQQFVYIPGSRKNKVLLVAHSDTVFDRRKKKIKPKYRDGTYSSTVKQIGIGADDRAGIAILWKLRKSGHSLLIPNGEECGCVGTRFLMQSKNWAKEINSHQFAIEFDRRGSSDLVFYQVGSPDFLKWLEPHYPGYHKAFGSFTDICELCRDMCGLNISVGYYDQHFAVETLVKAEWQRTLDLTRKMLTCKKIPKFEIKSFYNYPKSYDRPNNLSWPDSAYSRSVSLFEKQGMPASSSISGMFQKTIGALLVCPECGLMQEKIEIENNAGECVKCHMSVL